MRMDQHSGLRNFAKGGHKLSKKGNRLAEFAELRAEIIAAMRAIVPGEGVIADDAMLKAFECDGLMAYRQLPLIVVLPETTAQVSDILRYCHENNVKHW